MNISATSLAAAAFALLVPTMLPAIAATSAKPSGEAAADDQAAQLEALRTYCRTSPAPCREHLRITLRRDNGKPYDRTFDLLPPAVQPDMVSVHPGETVRAVPLFKDGKFSGWRMPRPDEPAGTQIVTIHLAQAEKGVGMTAKVSTNSGEGLKLRMGLVRLDGTDQPEATSSCGLRSGGFTSFESWPYPIFVLLVADAKHLPDDALASCE